MIKNADILEAFERSERRRLNYSRKPKDWYSKADELYDLALIINPEIAAPDSERHLTMLIGVRKQLKQILS